MHVWILVDAFVVFLHTLTRADLFESKRDRSNDFLVYVFSLSSVIVVKTGEKGGNKDVY